MKYLTDEILLGAIERLGSEAFDSHALLQDLMTHHPHDYVRELNEKIRTEDPILQTHSDIASQLNFAPLSAVVENLGQVSSLNVRGKRTTVHKWRRRKTA